MLPVGVAALGFGKRNVVGYSLRLEEMIQEKRQGPGTNDLMGSVLKF